MTSFAPPSFPTMDDELDHLSLEELREFHRLNKQMIARLEDESQSLKKQIFDFSPGAELALGMNFRERTDGMAHLEEMKRFLQNDRLVLQRRLDETTELTGVSISHLEESVEFEGDRSCKSVDATLQVQGRDIVLKCEILKDLVQSENGKDEEGSCVSWLEVQIPREINNVIGDALKPVIQEASIHPTLSLIQSYMKCATERDKLFTHFIELYPNNVERRDRESCQGLMISTKDVRQPAFVVEWDFALQQNFRYKSDVKLVDDSTEELRSKDSKGVLASAPEMFSHMTSLLGVERALDRFIRMVVSEGEDIMSVDELTAFRD